MARTPARFQAGAVVLATPESPGTSGMASESPAVAGGSSIITVTRRLASASGSCTRAPSVTSDLHVLGDLGQGGHLAHLLADLLGQLAEAVAAEVHHLVGRHDAGALRLRALSRHDGAAELVGAASRVLEKYPAMADLTSLDWPTIHSTGASRTSPS
ncbi:MAG: hypothetical protein IPK12_16475 [Gemmatimonadetes bacterium]|nr:hypothetical protein [Gemmatimonadota bacterium]